MSRGQDGDAAGLQAVEDLRLGAGDAVLAVGKIADVDGQHVSDNGDVRARHAGQRADFLGVIHADLDHGEIDVRRHPRECQRNAPVVVERFFRRMDFAGGRETGAQHFLGASLAGAAGDCDDASGRAQPPAGGDGDAFERAQRIVDADKWTASGGGGEVMTHEGRGGAVGECSADEIMTVALVRDRNEDLAGRKRSRVDRKTGDGDGGRTIGGAVRGRDKRVPTSTAARCQP